MTGEDNLLNYLLRKGLTPSFSFPLQVAKFVVEGKQEFRRKVWASTSQDLKVALSEYTPGKVLMVDGVEYEVNGLHFSFPPDPIERAKHVFQDGSLKHYTWCSTDGCGWVHKNVDTRSDVEKCPICEQSDNINYSRYLEPEGFAPLIAPYAPGKDEIISNPANLGGPLQKAPPSSNNSSSGQTGKVEMPAPLLNEEDIDMKPVENIHDHLGENYQLITMYSSPPSTIDKSGIELILVNSGYNKRGYYICEKCGRTEVEKPNNIIKDEGHLRPYSIITNKDNSDTEKALARDFCKGRPYREFEPNEGEPPQWTPIMLGMVFHSDMISFRFKIQEPFKKDAEMRRSKAFNGGLLAIKEALITELQSKMNYVNREIGGGIRKFAKQADSDSPREDFVDIFLYDQVSGGAGLVTSLKDSPELLPEILESVEARLSGESCLDKEGCDRACIGCLLDFRNKGEHSLIHRKYGLSILQYLKEGKLLTSDEIDGRDIQIIAMTMNDMFEDVEVECIERNDRLVISIKFNDEQFFIRPISTLMNPLNDPLIHIDRDFNEEWAADGYKPEKAFETVENLKNRQLYLLKLIRDSVDPAADLFG
jgi:hypothetical protein